ncbi:MAG TPA: vWA domain-containing protein [Thermoanaerobaculia bacterium]
MTFDDSLSEVTTALRAGAWDDAIAKLDALVPHASSDAERALIDLHRASIAVLRGDRDADMNVFRKNVIRRHSARHVHLATYYLLVNAIDRNDRAIAERYFPTYLEVVETVADPLQCVASWDIAGAIESMRGNHVAAIEYGRAALADCAPHQDGEPLLTRIFITHNLAYNCLAANLFAEALQYAKEALAMAERDGRPDILRQLLVTTAFAYLCREQLDDAEALAHRAEPITAGTRLERYVHYLHGEIARRRGDLDAASHHFRRLEEFYPDTPGVAEILLTLNVAPFLLPE